VINGSTIGCILNADPPDVVDQAAITVLSSMMSFQPVQQLIRKVSGFILDLSFFGTGV